MKKLLVTFLMLICLVLSACSSPSEKEVCPICGNVSYAESMFYDELDSYKPTTFDETSVTYVKAVEVGSGVMQYTIDFNLNNGNRSRVVATEVDLTKASIVAGSTNNNTAFTKISKLTDQVASYEEDNPSSKVLVATNADFFGNGVSVNAFVKDSVIVKAAHNDNGVYDYTNVNADLPASMPMLFGISGSTAQIAPIINSSNVQETVQSALFYELVKTKGEISEIISTNVSMNVYACPKDQVSIIYKTGRELTAPAKSVVLKLARHNDASTRVHGKVLEVLEVDSATKFKANDEEYYIVIPQSLKVKQVNVGDYLSYNINSSDNTWQYYDTILGCRQALVLNGEIANTVKLENSNGAQTTNIPRTAIGIKPNGIVVIFSVESLRYGAKNYVDSDSYGLNLPQLADFMRYYGVYNGANFDGGGSTSLITRSGYDGSGDFEVVVRSSDYGTSSITDSRSIINSLLVVTKTQNSEE